MGKYIFIIALIFLFGLNSTISYSQQSFCGMSETSGKQETTMQLVNTFSHWRQIYYCTRNHNIVCFICKYFLMIMKLQFNGQMLPFYQPGRRTF